VFPNCCLFPLTNFFSCNTTFFFLHQLQSLHTVDFVTQKVVYQARASAQASQVKHSTTVRANLFKSSLVHPRQLSKPDSPLHPITICWLLSTTLPAKATDRSSEICSCIRPASTLSNTTCRSSCITFATCGNLVLYAPDPVVETYWAALFPL
jgi:hypothetical protein